MIKFHIKAFLSLLILVFLSLHSIFAQEECAEKVWEWGGALKMIAYATFDIDNDGISEIISSSSQLVAQYRTLNYWQVYGYNTAFGDFENEYTAFESEGAILQILGFDYDNDGDKEILLFIDARSQGMIIKLIDPDGFIEIDRLEMVYPFQKAFLHDFHNDGSEEILVSLRNAHHVVVEAGDSLQEVYYGPGSYEDVGNIDDDPELEAINYLHARTDIYIDTFSGYQSVRDTVFSITSDNGGIHNAYLVDIDQDSKEELVVEQRVNGYLQFYKLDSISLAWEWEDTAASNLLPSTTGDLDGDDNDEILYLYSKADQLYFSLGGVDASEEIKILEIDTLISRYSGPAVRLEMSTDNLDDTDGLELIIFGDGNLYVMGLDSSGIKFGVPRISGGLNYMATLADDLNSDGALEYIIAGNFYQEIEYGSPSGPQKGWLRINDAVSHELQHASQLKRTNYAISNTFDIASEDIYGDSIKEIVLVGKSGIYPKLTILNAESFEPDTTLELGRDFSITNVEIADLENDGQNEIFISFRADTNTPDYFLYCLNGDDLSIKFKAVSERWIRNTGIYSMRSGDIDGNGDDEVILQMVGSYYGNNHTLIINLDHTGNVVVDTAFHNFSGLGLDLEDMNGDGTKDIVASNGLGIVKSFDYKNDSLIWEKQVSDYSINCLRVYNVDPDSTKELVVIDDGALSIYDLDEDSLKCTDIYGYTLGFINNMYVGDKDNDGTIEVFTSGIISVLEFELNPFAAVGVEDYGFESKEILIYPNPNSGNFQLALPTRGDEISSVKIYSLLGELIWEQEIRNRDLSEMNIQLPGISNGIYLVQIWNEKELLWTTKMSVQD